MDLMVSDFVAGDQAAVERLIQAGLRDRWGDLFDPSFNVDVTNVQQNYLDVGATVLVGRVADEIVATGMLLVDENMGQIVRMSVAAHHRRQGFARSMVEALIERACSQRLHHVRVSTDTPWHSAIALYRSCGFSEVGHDATDTHFELALK